MCPACLTTMALMAASATSTGGMAAFVAKRLRASEKRSENFYNPNQKDPQEGGEKSDDETQNRHT
jgi:hypothetical protein